MNTKEHIQGQMLKTEAQIQTLKDKTYLDLSDKEYIKYLNEYLEECKLKLKANQ